MVEYDTSKYSLFAAFRDTGSRSTSNSPFSKDRDTRSAGGSSSSSSSSSGSSSSKSKGIGNGARDGLVFKLGFKFDVANFDINAVSPTSW